MQQDTELRIAKRKALAFLLFAFAVFIATLFVPHGFAAGWVRAASEAAMVGGLADWFAVAALFRRIPLPGLAGHTNIVARKKDDIADGLAAFVRDKFLDVPSVVALIDRHNPAQAVAQWLAAPGNTREIGDVVAKVAGTALDLMDERDIQAAIRHAAHAMIGKVDLSRSAATILESLTENGRHQALLDASLAQLIRLLNEPGTRAFIAERIVEWLKSEHPKKERILPTEWIGSNGADLVAAALGRVLGQVEADTTHQLRRAFDDAVATLIARLKDDPAFHARADRIRQQLQGDSALNAYLGGLWADWRGWLKQDLARADSVVHRKVMEAGHWIGAELARSPSLRASLNDHLREAARGMAPDFAEFVTRHISSTVRGWDAREMARQIELSVGRDLQYIRMNGTLVGGLIGAVLYLVAQMPALLGRL
ncbi:MULTISPECIES: DUF445 domain-containing protein [Cupriavidus]|uniref:DUF445 domain-containing protein n=1 Tax=Cupriavidus TaxID=106589 RepID=UPI0003656C02|nr:MULTISPECIES: DUF445 family protein [Cupriavidus]